MAGEPLARPLHSVGEVSWPQPMSRVRLDVSRPEAGVAVLSVSGEIDLVESDAIRGELADLLRDDRARLVVLDMCAVRFMGSHGLTAVVQGQRLAAQLGRTLRGVTGEGNRAVSRPLAMTGLDQLIEWFPRLTDATARAAG